MLRMPPKRPRLCSARPPSPSTTRPRTLRSRRPRPRGNPQLSARVPRLQPARRRLPSSMANIIDECLKAMLQHDMCKSGVWNNSIAIESTPPNHQHQTTPQPIPTQTLPQAIKQTHAHPLAPPVLKAHARTGIARTPRPMFVYI